MMSKRMQVSLSKIKVLPFKEQCTLVWCMTRYDFVEASLHIMNQFPYADTTQLQIRFLDETRSEIDLQRLLSVKNPNYNEIALHILKKDDVFGLNYVIDSAKKRDTQTANSVMDIIVGNTESAMYPLAIFDILLSHIVRSYDYRKVVKKIFDNYPMSNMRYLVDAFKEKVGSKELNEFIREQLIIEDVLN